MERDPHGGEAKKASPGHIPSESEIDDLLWATYGINPRRQKEYKPLTKDDILHMPLEEMNASGAIWSRLSAAQANCKPLTNDDQKHVDPELTVRKCPKCTNQIKPGSYTEHVAKCDGKYCDFGGLVPKPNAGGATG